MDRENSEVKMEMQRKERLNEKESREARKTARRKSVEVWATDCERVVEPINRADFMSGFDDGWLSAVKYAENATAIRKAAEAVIEHFYTYRNCECGVPVSLHGNLTSCSLSSNGSAELSALKGALEGK